MPDAHDNAVHIARIQTRLDHIDRQLTALVTRVEFDPVRRIVYGLVALILIAFVSAGTSIVTSEFLADPVETSSDG